MSRHPHYANHPAYNRPPIVVTDNDVLCGRGVNIAHHPGNERFRTLVTTRADESYCTTYSASEKRAVALEIIRHIKSLDPPGRFLKREGRGQVSRGLNGPWEELSEREAIKKTCQALRDCNRNDRAGYAVGVVPPDDVMKVAEDRSKSGLSGKQHAARAAAQAAAEAAAAASATLKRNADHFGIPGGPILPPLTHPGMHAFSAAGIPGLPMPGDGTAPQAAPQPGGRVSPSVENAAGWLTKKQRTDGGPSADGNPAPVGSDGMLVSSQISLDPTTGAPIAPVPAAPAAPQTSVNGEHHQQQQHFQQAYQPHQPYQFTTNYANPNQDAQQAAAAAAAAAAAGIPTLATTDMLQQHQQLLEQHQQQLQQQQHFHEQQRQQLQEQQQQHQLQEQQQHQQQQQLQQHQQQQQQHLQQQQQQQQQHLQQHQRQQLQQHQRQQHSVGEAAPAPPSAGPAPPSTVSDPTDGLDGLSDDVVSGPGGSLQITEL